MTTTKPSTYVQTIQTAAAEYSSADRIRYDALAKAGKAIVALESLKGKTLSVFVTEWATSNDANVLNDDGTVASNAIVTIISETLKASLASNADSAIRQFKSNAISSVTIETNGAFEPFRERMTAEVLKRIAPELGDVPKAVAILSKAIETADNSAGTKDRTSVAQAVATLRKDGGDTTTRIVAKNYFAKPIANVEVALAALQHRDNLTVENVTAFVHILNIAFAKNQVEMTDDVATLKALSTSIETLIAQVA